MSSKKQTSGCSLTGSGILIFLVFLVLKLTNTITWSWLWVTSPLWISFGITLIFLGIGFLIMLLGVLAVFLTKGKLIRKKNDK